MPLHTLDEVRKTDLMTNLQWLNQALLTMTAENIAETGQYIFDVQTILRKTENFHLSSGSIASYGYAVEEQAELVERVGGDGQALRDIAAEVIRKNTSIRSLV